MGHCQVLNFLPADRPTPRVQANAERLDSEIVYDRDFDYDYFGFKTLERSYLLRVNGKVVERPQHMLMRVAVGIHGEDVEAGASLVPQQILGAPTVRLPLRHAAPGPSAGSSPCLAAFCTDRLVIPVHLVAAVETYHLLSQRWFTHASPTLFNAGTPRPQLSSCFLVCMKNDSIEGAKQQWSLCVVACPTRCSCARELEPYPPPCHIPLLKAFMTPSKSVPASRSLRAALVSRCTTSAPPARTFEAPMAPAMESCPCCACSMTQVGRC